MERKYTRGGAARGGGERSRYRILEAERPWDAGIEGFVGSVFVLCSASGKWVRLVYFMFYRCHCVALYESARKSVNRGGFLVGSLSDQLSISFACTRAVRRGGDIAEGGVGAQACDGRARGVIGDFGELTDRRPNFRPPPSL